MSALHAATLVLWDVDHTLIENSGVSKENYALAFELLTGRAPAAHPRTDGRTDIAIMADMLKVNGVASDAFSVERQLAALAEAGRRNASRLRELGYALPGAAASLKRLAGEPNVIQSVLTGNIESNARIKLGAFGLDQWLDFSAGGFGADHEQRAVLVPVAQGKARRMHGFDSTQGATVLIGDTPLDVEAGLIGGARIIAVATGVTKRDELEAAGADVVLDGLEDTDALMAALRTVQDLGPTGPRSPAPTGM
jgi:phosphoglycolate phosphatase-like HAD superfamily hydrolase